MVVLDLNPRLAAARRDNLLSGCPPLVAFNAIAGMMMSGPFRTLLAAAICAQASFAASSAFLEVIARTAGDV